MTLVDYFPNIATLELRSFALEPDGGPIPPLSRPLRGKVHIHRVSNHLEFLDRFAKLDLEYEGLVIHSPSFFRSTKFVEGALRISANTVAFLSLTAELQQSNQPLPTLLIETTFLLTPLVFKPGL